MIQLVEFVTAVALLLATAPLVLELLVLTAAACLPERRPRSIAAAAPLHTVVLVPAHNEELLVGRCVRSLMCDLPANCEVQVIAHNCSDETAARALEAGAEVVVFDDPQASGKGSALRFGFARALFAGAEAVVVVDADSVVTPGFAATVQQALSHNADAVQCRYTVLPPAESQQALTALAFAGFNVVRPQGRHRLGLSAGLFGNGFGFRAEVLARVPYHALSIVEDLEYHIALVRSGLRVHYVDHATVGSEMPTGADARATQRTRWEGGRWLMMREEAPRLIADLLRGRVRCIEPLLDALSLPLATGVFLLLMALLLPLSWIRVYALASLITVALHVAVAATAGGIGAVAAAKAVASAPQYILWKLFLLPKTLLASRKGAAWVRTDREPAHTSAVLLRPADAEDRLEHEMAGGANA